MRLITKDIFLKSYTCPTLGWEVAHSESNDLEEVSLFDRFQMEEGIQVHERARKLYPDGVMVSGSNESAAALTERCLQNSGVSVIFEATFIVDGFITKADILIREGSGWRIIEVKSGTKDDKAEYIDDLAYTTMVTKMAGVDIVGSSLMLISKEYRLGMPERNLFEESDCTEKIAERVKEFQDACGDLAKSLNKGKKPKPELRWECKKCPIFDDCCGVGIENHIFDLPRISPKKFCQLRDMGVVSIKDIPSDFKLTDSQERVRKAVKSGKAVIGEERRWVSMDGIESPIYYLDFETVITAIPLYPDVAPYTQIPTQYSIHICDKPNNIIDHKEYLANPNKDCRRELAENLIKDSGSKGTIFSYSSFEKTVIKGLSKLFPDLAEELEKLIDRLEDL